MSSKINFQFLYVLILIAGILLTLFFGMMNSGIIIFLTLMMLILGLPHGALDHKVAEKHFHIKKIESKALFLIAYTVIAVLYFGFWLLNPLIAFSIFLLISAAHWGMDFEFKGYRYLKSFLIGIAIVSAPVIIHGEIVIDIFNLLLPSEDAIKLVQFMKVISIVTIFLVLIILIKNYKIQKNNCIEIFFTIIAALILHPILYLTLYFCFSHSIKSYSKLYEYLEFYKKKSFIISLLPITLVSIIFLLIIMVFFNEYSFDDTFFKSLMLLILSLTMPHMLLVELALEPKNKL